ncbi:hypothetical protein [Azospirillum sp. ST 5-10]|uniref:hypothetical protein n=1 Tax=Azospirillum sp. ST 5-10 TaxID=3445776 RepID=UPI003F49E70D
MAEPDRRAHPAAPAPIPAEKARGARIALTTPARRAIFIAGLVGFVVLALLGWAVAAPAGPEAVPETVPDGGGPPPYVRSPR